jgi:NDP-sugar pyrophosphorylase family protein
MPDIANIPVALLAGGLATRLRPTTEKIPKALVPVAGRPFIDHQLELFHRHGIRKVVLCLGYLGEMVREHLGENFLGVQLSYSFDGERLMGTGGAVRKALPMLGQTFWVIYGDSYMDIDYQAVLAAFQAQPSALGLMTVLENQNRWDKSNVIFREGKLLQYDKKSTSPEMHHIDYGIALLRRPAAERIPTDEPSDLADLYRDLVSEGSMIGYEVHERFYEIGTPASLAEADAYLATVKRR